MKVTIYIDVYYSGNLSKGIGTYNIMLEYIKPDGTPKTREYYECINSTTKYRTAIRACIEALNHITKTCEIKIIINSQFIANSINQKWDKTKNADLWQQLLATIKMNKVTFEYSLSNPYSTYMFLTAKRVKKTCKEDTRSEDNLQQRGSSHPDQKL